jgi:hypothetical protein
MGWWLLDIDVPDDVDAYFRSELAGAHETVLDSTIVPGSVRITALDGFADVTAGDYAWYAAILDDTTGNVSCTAALYFAAPPFRYSAKHETEDPDLATCPASVLDRLTPVPDCQHHEIFCRYCDCDIVESAAGHWVSVDVPGGYTAGTRCSAAPEDGAHVHVPGGSGECPVCVARDWRRRCRESLAS